MFLFAISLKRHNKLGSQCLMFPCKHCILQGRPGSVLLGILVAI